MIKRKGLCWEIIGGELSKELLKRGFKKNLSIFKIRVLSDDEGKYLSFEKDRERIIMGLETGEKLLREIIEVIKNER